MTTGYGIAVDSAGNAYVTGYTDFDQLPEPAMPFQATLGSQNVFVAKLNPAGTALVYSTYLGGDGSSYGNGIAVDSAGDAYVTGYTDSTNSRPPPAPSRRARGSDGTDAFVAKLNPAGSALVYSTYLGGSWRRIRATASPWTRPASLRDGHHRLRPTSRPPPAPSRPRRWRHRRRLRGEAEPGGLGPGLLHLPRRQQR